MTRARRCSVARTPDVSLAKLTRSKVTCRRGYALDTVDGWMDGGREGGMDDRLVDG